tara:strand:+ start:105 stop:221 length:117 start_codon:yes stop_codon:yes gene_type:complete
MVKVRPNKLKIIIVEAKKRLYMVYLIGNGGEGTLHMFG